MFSRWNNHLTRYQVEHFQIFQNKLQLPFSCLYALPTHLFLKQPKKSFYHLSIKWIIGNQSVNGFIFRNGDGHTLRIIINATSFLSVTFFFILSGPASSTYLMSILLVAISSYNLHFLWFQFKGWVKFKIIVRFISNKELFNNNKLYCYNTWYNFYVKLIHLKNNILH